MTKHDQVRRRDVLPLRGRARAHVKQLPQLAQVRVEPLAGELDAGRASRRGEHRRPGNAERRRTASAVICGPCEVKTTGWMKLLREPDREERDRDQHDAEERIDRAHARARHARLDREAEHEVRAVEEEQHEEEHELVLAPRPPDAPRGLRPDRAGDERQRAEDHALVDRDVALEVGALVARAQVPKRLPRPPAEARVRRQRDRHVEVEDALREALVGVGRRVEERGRRADRRVPTGRRWSGLAQLHGGCMRSPGASGLGHDVLERGPAEHGEDRVVEQRGTRGTRPTPPTTIGIAIGRKSSGSRSSRARPATAIAPKSVPTAAMPRSASATAATVRPSRPREERANAGSATTSAAARKREHGERLAEPDRTAVARREHERVEHPLLAFGHERARQAEERGEDQRDPEQAAARRRRSLPCGSAKWKIVSAASTNSSIGGQRLLRPQLEQQVLARERCRRRRRTSCERQPLGGATLDALRLVRRDDHGAAARRECRRAARRPARRARCTARRAASSDGSCSSTRQRPSRCCIPRENVATRSCRTSQSPKRSSSIPTRSPRSGMPVEPAEQRQVLERRELAVDERLVSEVADRRALRQLQLAGGRRGEPARACAAASSCPEPFGPVTSRKPPSARSRSTPAKTRRSP